MFNHKPRHLAPFGCCHIQLNGALKLIENSHSTMTHPNVVLFTIVLLVQIFMCLNCLVSH